MLVVSTDPAHSLGDALGVKLSHAPKAVGAGSGRRGSARESFDAVELDAPRAFARWLREHRRPLAEILEHGTWLDAEDIDALLDLAIPGVDELMGILEIARVTDAAPRGAYDLVIVDTAPTGHTLRLLAAPETVSAVAAALDGLQQEHRLIRQRLARVGRQPEAADRLIALLAEQAHAAAARLRDPRQTRFCWVTLPEELSLEESVDAIAALHASGLRVSEVVVNRVLPPAPTCRVCDRRRVDEARVIARIRARVGRGRDIRIVPATIDEPVGARALAPLGRSLTASAARESRAPLSSRRSPARLTASGDAVLSAPDRAGAHAPETIAAFSGASLLFFGGKGGVGKTTVAAATAVRLARAEPKRRILLLSTDPAHSVADVLVGQGVPPNLKLHEIDAAHALADRRAQLEAALDEVGAAAGAFGASTTELLDLAPPGIDELFGILSVIDARSDYGLIVVDTAPTGHALRLLEMPDAAREWTQLLLRVLLKYRSLARPGLLAAEIVELSRSVRGLQALLRDRRQTRFIVVTRASALPRAETERLLRSLRRPRLAAPDGDRQRGDRGAGPLRWRCRATATAGAA